MSYLEHYPSRDILLKWFDEANDGSLIKVNNHIHSPYSFSAFKSIGEAVQMAAFENVRVLGINDFYVTDGYGEFIEHCLEQGIFPILNVELIGISKADQVAGIRINDPNNPGRIYISGKGLAFPSILPGDQQKKIEQIIHESNRQVGTMVQLLNSWMERQGVDLILSVKEIMEKQAMKLLRERHLAKMIRIKLQDSTADDQEFYTTLNSMYGGVDSVMKMEDVAGLEEELRAKLLKSGAPAFVPEDEKAFLPVEDIIQMIRDAGGIPTYPVLLDGAGDSVTEFERAKEQLLEALLRWGIHSVEFIPLRNRFEKLKEYAEYFYGNGFVVSFGTEHNTTAMRPLTVSCKGEAPLDQQLMQISYLGAAYIAAHQYLVDQEGTGYKQLPRSEMEHLGKAIIHHNHHDHSL